MKRIDAHHHLWDLNAVSYPWLMEKGKPRFFGDPTPIQRDFLLDEFRSLCEPHGFIGSVHVQVGAEDSWAEARWIQSVCEANPDWPMVQVAFCDLVAEGVEARLERLASLSSVRGVRQIVGRSPQEDRKTGTNDLLRNPRFAESLRLLERFGFSFDLQLLPELMQSTVEIIAEAPSVKVALCHAGSPWDRSAEGLRLWASRLESLSALPNVYCKLSGLGMFDSEWNRERISPIVETCLSQFGVERCMFGSNFPVDALHSDYASLVEAYESLIPQQGKAEAFGAVASRFYAIREEAKEKE